MEAGGFGSPPFHREKPMPTKKPSDGEMTVLVDGAISDGDFGFLKKGAKFKPVDKEAGEQLRARKIAE